mmetsp:Transcript_28013/g.51137  ORF Transcript_28013/g.51137 Transcript_28013/m.51137 type:complete len:207 (+) Transcript_28013:221-841(+)
MCCFVMRVSKGRKLRDRKEVCWNRQGKDDAPNGKNFEAVVIDCDKLHSYSSCTGSTITARPIITNKERWSSFTETATEVFGLCPGQVLPLICEALRTEPLQAAKPFTTIGDLVLGPLLKLLPSAHIQEVPPLLTVLERWLPEQRNIVVLRPHTVLTVIVNQVSLVISLLQPVLVVHRALSAILRLQLSMNILARTVVDAADNHDDD